MNEDKIVFDLKMLKKFINNSLGLNYEKYEVTGYELLTPILEASAYNTYIETISNKADTLNIRIKESLVSMMEHAYLNYIKNIS